jgi:hypothetical protein
MESIEAEGNGLQDAIRLVFSVHGGEWISASAVRDHMMEMGFDFRHYQANPLASITTTLKRMVPSYLESSTTATGGTLYRRREVEKPKQYGATSSLSNTVLRKDTK